MRPTRRRVAAGLAVAAVLVGAAVVSPAWLRPRLVGVLASPWFPLVLVGLYLLRPLLAWPVVALSALVGYRYGVAVGTPVALAGVVVTSLPAFLVARHADPGDGRLGRLVRGSERFFGATGGLRGVVAARLAPTPAEPVSLAAGAAGVSLSAFVAGTLLGELPWTAVAVLAGASMRRLALAPSVDPLVYVAATLAAIVLLAGPAYRYLRSNTPGAG